MNEPISSKDWNLQDETDLIRHFYALIAEYRILPFKAHAHLHKTAGYDGYIEFTLDDQVLRFDVEFKLRPSIADVPRIRRQDTDKVLLVTPDLNEKLLQACKDAGISAMDLNGRVWLRAPGIYVERGPIPGRRFRYEHEPRNIFVGKSLQIVRCLLTNRDHIWTQAELLDRTEASSGLVPRIVQHIISQDYLEKLSARELRLRDHLSLIDAWVKADDFTRRTRTTRYTGLIADFNELAHRLQNLVKEDHFPIAFTQWFAASARHPWVDAPVVSAYVSRLPSPGILDLLDLREVSEGGKLWLHVPDEGGVFRETQLANGFQVASDAQIYLDLQHTGLRGPDAADALRNWEGFCRP